MSNDRFDNLFSSFNFQGYSNSKIQIPFEGLNLKEYTYSFWVKLDKYPQSGERFCIISVGSTSGDFMCSYDNGYIAGGSVYRKGWVTSQYTNQNSNHDVLESGIKTELNIWNHIVITRSNTEFSIFINGNKIKSYFTYGIPSYGIGTPSATLGTRFDGSLAFKGNIDDVKIYTKSIDLRKVKELYNEGICNTASDITNVLSIKENNSNEILNIFPNPTQNELKVDLGDNYYQYIGGKLSLYNVFGVLINSLNIESKNSNFDLKNLESGIYFLSLFDINSEIISTKKFVINK
jgi:hypothetical protein